MKFISNFFLFLSGHLKPVLALTILIFSALVAPYCSLPVFAEDEPSCLSLTRSGTSGQSVLENLVQNSSLDFSFVALDCYEKELPIGGTFYLGAYSTTGKKVSFKSSSSAVASVNVYGMVTAKKAGTATITAKCSGAEAYCRVTVIPTTVKLNRKSVSLERGESFRLTVSTSTGGSVKYKTSAKSVATVSSDGVITAAKPGTATITATCEGSSVTCTVTVKKPTITLSAYSIELYRNQGVRLKAQTSSNVKPAFKSSKSSVATVDDYGYIRAVKNGTASIKVTLDGVTRICTVTVLKPDISLNKSCISLKAGKSFALKATVSSGNAASFRSSNTKVATVDENGVITARQKGKAYIYASEDGTKVSCIVTVTE